MEKQKGSPTLTFTVLVILCLIPLGIAEVWARGRVSDSEITLVPGMPFLVDDPTLLWRLRPSARYRLWEQRSMQTNALGLRDDEVTEKAPGTVRILSLGESTTWGHGVEAAQTYTELIGKQLTRPERPVDAINGGVPAWSIYQSMLYLNQAGYSLKPDIIILYHLQNDRMSRGPSNPQDPFHVSLTDRQLSEARQPFASLLGLFSGSRLRILLWRQFGPGLSAQPGGTDVPRVPDPDREMALKNILDQSIQRGITVILAKPVYGRGKLIEDRMLEKFVHYADNVIFVDLPRAKAQQNIPDTGFFQIDDAHPTPEGHAWIAQQLIAVLGPKVQP